MEREIRDTLDRIETREDVRVLYAVETGSRAWGFASTDSDWDVRLLYLRRPEWYLSIQRSCTGRHSPRPLGSGCCRPVTSPPGPACTTTRAWRRGTTASTSSAIRCASRNTSTCSARCWRAAGSRCTARRPRPSSRPGGGPVAATLASGRRGPARTQARRRRAGRGSPDRAINEFLDRELASLRARRARLPPAPEPDWPAIDELFRASLAETWKEGAR